jgi:hypothetical protein
MADFWLLVFERFEIIMREEYTEEFVVRDPGSLRNRFGKRITKLVFIWLGYMRRVRILRPSGVPEEEYYEMATARYNESEDKPFPFDHCVKIIEECPVFSNMVEDLVPPDFSVSNNDGAGATVVINAINNTTAAMGAHLKRPMGQKAAKQKATKEKEKERRDSSSVVTSFTTIAESNNHLADELKERTTVMRATMTMLQDQNKVNNLFQMIELYRKSGNVERADDLMGEAERLILMEKTRETEGSDDDEIEKMPTLGDAFSDHHIENVYYDENRESFASGISMTNTTAQETPENEPVEATDDGPTDAAHDGTIHPV